MKIGLLYLTAILWICKIACIVPLNMF